MARRGACLWLVSWITSQTAGAAVGASTWLQPADSTAGVAFELGRRAARVWSDERGARRVRLRSGERLTATVELADGWVAAGVRPEGEGQDLFLLAGGSGATRRLAPPPGPMRPTWRTRPVPLATPSGLEGLAWLEGSPRGLLTVRAAGRSDDDWELPTTVAWPASGSQSGLAGAVLPDGTWMLVWARFDGEDDELLWSVRQGGSWGPPAPVHQGNAVPDVTPTLFPLSDGALLAWSRLIDGEYRVFTARTEPGGWTTPLEVLGPGGVFPGFAGRDGTPFLLARSAVPPGWVVIELDSAGQPLRRAVAAAGDPSRPALVLGSGRPPSLRLPPAGAAAPLVWEAVP